MNKERIFYSSRKPLRLLSLLCILILNGCAEQRQVFDKNAVEQEVRLAFEAFSGAARALNHTEYFRYFDAQKFVGLNANGSNWNDFAAFKAFAEPGLAAVASVESLRFPNVVISVIDDHTAVLVNEYEQRILLKNGVSLQLAGGGTQVWSKSTGTWTLVSVSASAKPMHTGASEQ